MAKRHGEGSSSPRRGRLRLRQRILLGYLLPAVILVLVALAVYNAAAAAAARADRQAEVEQNVVETFGAANEFERLVAANRGYVGSLDPAFLAQYDQLVVSLAATLEALAGDLRNPAAIAELEEATDAIERYEAIAERAQALAASGEEQAAGDLLATEGVPVVAEVRQHFGDLVEFELVTSAQAREETEAAMAFLTTVVVGAIVLGLVVSVGGGLLIASRTTGTIERGAVALKETSTDLAATVTQHERMANQQAAAVSETTSTMTELSSSARQTDEQAREATERAKQALALSENGAEAMRQTLEAVTALRERMGKMTDEVEELRDETKQISAVTDLVRDIADQTNMLAINASVEAARAGDHGRGFAVVAAEIRKLSDESRRSADRIGVHLSDIQRSANATGRVAEDGARTLRDVVDLTQRSADAFRGVTEAVNDAFERTQQISHSARQQSAAIQQVVEAMEGASAGVRETATGVRQTKAGIERLESVAEELQETV